MFPGMAPQDALEELIRAHPRLAAIVVKLGEEGAIGYDGARQRRFRISPFKTNAVDPTGAGDSFCGGFIAGIARGADVTRAALFGAVSASFVIETEGTLGLAGVTKESADQRLAALASAQEPGP